MVERRRLQLLRLILTEPNVLLLDEPTNDLDTDTLAALEDLLDSWAGTLIVVSHDRYLVERICDVTMALLPSAPGEPAQLLNLPGGIDEYLARRANSAVEEPKGRLETTREVSGKATDGRAARKEMSRLERQLAKIDEREKKLHAQMAEHATDFAKIAELDVELRAAIAERSDQAAWLATQRAGLTTAWRSSSEACRDHPGSRSRHRAYGPTRSPGGGLRLSRARGWRACRNLLDRRVAAFGLLDRQIL